MDNNIERQKWSGTFKNPQGITEKIFYCSIRREPVFFKGSSTVYRDDLVIEFTTESLVNHLIADEEYTEYGEYTTYVHPIDHYELDTSTIEHTLRFTGKLVAGETIELIVKFITEGETNG